MEIYKIRNKKGLYYGIHNENHIGTLQVLINCHKLKNNKYKYPIKETTNIFFHNKFHKLFKSISEIENFIISIKEKKDSDVLMNSLFKILKKCEIVKFELKEIETIKIETIKIE